VIILFYYLGDNYGVITIIVCRKSFLYFASNKCVETSENVFYEYVESGDPVFVFCGVRELSGHFH